jgi:hypothetical protein
MLGALSFMIGLIADLIATNRKLMERINLRLRRIEHRRIAEDPNGS